MSSLDCLICKSLWEETGKRKMRPIAISVSLGKEIC
uniref:Uncharacterized protein n=1 Tax=Arundo donax TaxID=35708 RepID=A0A0A9EWG1_ARUDO